MGEATVRRDAAAAGADNDDGERVGGRPAAAVLPLLRDSACSVQRGAHPSCRAGAGSARALRTTSSAALPKTRAPALRTGAGTAIVPQGSCPSAPTRGPAARPRTRTLERRRLQFLAHRDPFFVRPTTTSICCNNGSTSKTLQPRVTERRLRRRFTFLSKKAFPALPLGIFKTTPSRPQRPSPGSRDRVFWSLDTR